MPAVKSEPVRRDSPPLAAFVPLIGFMVLLALAAAFDPTRLHVPDVVALSIFAVAVAACAFVATPSVALLLTACAWLDYDGFVIGRDGTLSWHGGADLVRMGVLAATTALVLVVRATLLHRRRSRAR